MKVPKILFIKGGIDEKASSVILERSIARYLNLSTVVVVVPNAFVGLECRQASQYDIIFLEDRPRLPARAVIEILHNNLENIAPIFLILSEQEVLRRENEQLIDAGVLFGVLRLYQGDIHEEEFCRAVYQALTYTRPAAVISSSSATASAVKESEEYNMIIQQSTVSSGNPQQCSYLHLQESYIPMTTAPKEDDDEEEDDGQVVEEYSMDDWEAYEKLQLLEENDLHEQQLAFMTEENQFESEEEDIDGK